MVCTMELIGIACLFFSQNWSDIQITRQARPESSDCHISLELLCDQTNMTKEKQPWMNMYLLLKMVIFHHHIIFLGVVHVSDSYVHPFLQSHPTPVGETYFGPLKRRSARHKWWSKNLRCQKGIFHGKNWTKSLGGKNLPMKASK